MKTQEDTNTTTITLREDKEAREIVITFAGGEELRFDSSASPMSYIRFYEEGEETVGWNVDEVREDPELVLGAIFGKLCDSIIQSGLRSEAGQGAGGLLN